MLALQNMRDELRRSLGVDLTDMPDPQADELLNRSLWELTEKFPFREKEFSVTFDTVPAINKYTMPSNFESLLDICILTPNVNEYRVLTRATRVTYDNTQNVTVDAQDVPTEYVRDNDAIILFPVPDAIYTIRMRYLKSISDLTDLNSTLGLPRNWHEMVLLGGIWRGFITLGDYERAQASKAHQVSLLQSTVPIEAKEEFDSHISGVEVYGRTGSRGNL